MPSSEAWRLSCKSEERQAFLLELSDMLRLLAAPTAIQGEAARLLGEKLGADRALYSEHDGDTIVVHRDWVRGVPSIVGQYPAAVWGGEFVAAYRRGEPYVVGDGGADPRFDDTDRTAFHEARIAAFVGVGLIQDGQLVAPLGVHSSTPRAWTTDEVDLVRDTAERTWAAVERARAEAGLREGQARYLNLFETVPVGFGVLDLIRDESGNVSDWLVVELNPALERHTSLDRAALVGRRIKEAFPAGYINKLAASYREVIESQAPRQLEFFFSGVDRWLSITASPNAGERINLVYEDITERKRAEATLQGSEERQAFLLRLSDALRAEPSAEAMTEWVLQMLFKQMRLDHCYVGIYRLAEDTGEFPYQVHDDRLPPWPAQCSGTSERVRSTSPINVLSSRASRSPIGRLKTLKHCFTALRKCKASTKLILHVSRATESNRSFKHARREPKREHTGC